MSRRVRGGGRGDGRGEGGGEGGWLRVPAATRHRALRVRDVARRGRGLRVRVLARRDRGTSASAPTRHDQGLRAPARTRRDRGQVAVEYLGFLPILLLIALAGIQLGLAAYAAQQAGTGARAAARAVGHDDVTIGPEAAGRAAMSDWIAARANVDVVEGGGEAVATVSVDIPSVVPFWDFGRIEKTATLPVPEEGE